MTERGGGTWAVASELVPRAAERVDVLLVDDDPAMRMLVGLVLEDAGLSVVEACDGSEALAALATTRPRCVVLDVMMPNVDGFGVLETMAGLGYGQSTKVVMLSCRSSGRDMARATELGADAYMVKPFDPALIVHQVQALLA